MNVHSWLIWGFSATILMTLMMAGAQELRLTRANLPYILGSIVSGDRSRAKVYGILIHLGVGWLFSLVYVAIFETLGHSGLWRGAVIGLVHAAFVLVVAFPAMPGLHPRMASEHAGPVARRQLEPPGRFALHYGFQTPLVLILSHLLYGAILGAFYRV